MSKNKITAWNYYPWVVWGLGAAFFFAEYFARVAPSVMVPHLMRDFHVTALSLGSLSAFFYYAYVGMQIPVGMLVDRYSAVRLLSMMTLLFGVGCFLFAIADTVFIAQMGRLLMGFSASFAFVGTLKLATLWFPARRFGLLAGLTQALGMLGASVGAMPMSFVVSSIGWRNTMWVAGAVFIVLAFIMVSVMRDQPTKTVSESSLATGKKILAGLKRVLANPQSWWNALCVGLLYAPTAVFAELWGVSYLVRTYNLDPHVAALGISLIFIGWGVGGPLMGWLSDAILRRRPVMLLSAALGCVLMTIILYVPQLPLLLLFTLLFLYGVANTGVATAYAVASEINPHEIAGTSVAFSNMASVLVGAAFQPLVGWFLDLHWDGKMVDGIPFYSASDFHSAMTLLPFCFIGAFISAYFVRETFCQVIEEKKQ